MDNKNCDVLVLGAGPAGLTAGLYAARAGMKTIIIESLVAGGSVNLTPDIANFPGFLEISGTELGVKMLEQTEAAGAEIVYDEVTGIDLAKKNITCSEANFSFKSLIIATGASPRKLGVGREEDFIGSGIHFCGLCDGVFYKDKQVIIVGGGNHAVEEALYMSGIAKKVTIVNNIDRLTAQQTLIDQLDPKIKIYLNCTVTKIQGDTKITGIELSNGTAINADGIFVAIGRVPNTGQFKDKLELSRHGYIITDAKMQTNVPGIFAAGDIVDKNVRQVITACADGAIAATYATEYIKQ